MKKTVLPCLGLAMVCALTCPVPAQADDASATAAAPASAAPAAAAPAATAPTAAAPAKVKTYSGIVSDINASERRLSVKSFWRSRTFNAGEKCPVSLSDKLDATLEDLHPGQKVLVEYQEKSGVLIASRIAQRDLVFAGEITLLDSAKATMRVSDGWRVHDFSLPDKCDVAMAGNKHASLEDLKLGQTVSVTYETGKAANIAQRIEQRSPIFSGTLRAVDADSRIVRVKNGMSEKTFHLADGCRIVANGKFESNLMGFRIGDPVSLTYDTVNGVMIANRIGRETAVSENGGAQAAAANPNN